MLPFSVWHILTGARFSFIAHSILIKYSWSKHIWPNEKSNGDTSYACFNSIFVSADEQTIGKTYVKAPHGEILN